MSRVAPGVFRQRSSTGFGTWTEDTVTFSSASMGSNVTYERRWHAPIVARLVAPAMRLAWRSAFSTGHENFEKFLQGQLTA